MPSVLKKIDNRLYIIGVAHVLPRSAAEVGELITRERPDIVAVELDPIRYMALTQGKSTGLFDAIRAGPNLFLLSALLYLTQGKFSRQTGMPAGEEMLVALKHAREVGAQIQFIDQNIGITLQRLVNRMSRREKLMLFGQLLVSLLPVGKSVDLESLTDDQIVDSLLNEFKKTSPTAYEVLIMERDSYMSSRLTALLLSGKKVVCVVGAGHVPGIYEKLSKLTSGEWRMNLDYTVGG